MEQIVQVGVDPDVRSRQNEKTKERELPAWKFLLMHDAI